MATDFRPLERAPTIDMIVPEMPDDLFDLDEQYDGSQLSVETREVDEYLALFEQTVEAAKDTQHKKMQDILRLRKDAHIARQALGDENTSADEMKRLKMEESRINHEYLSKFGQKRGSMWHHKTRDGRNFLHHLAYLPWIRSNPYPLWIITSAILQRPSLMEALDNRQRTPLTAAIAENNREFCTAVFTLPLGNLQPMGQHLVVECRPRDFYRIHDQEITCLHAALSPNELFDSERPNRAKVLTSMIRIVPKEMFTVRDSQGRTPLHLAVHYESCSMSSQFEIVKLLLQHGPEALDHETKLDSGRLVSVYQYHENSRKIGEEKHERELREQENQLSQRRQREQQQSSNRDARDPEIIQAGPIGSSLRVSFKTPTHTKSKHSDSWLGAMEPPQALPVPKVKADANISSRLDSMTFQTPLSRDGAQLLSKVWGTASYSGVSPRVTAQPSPDSKRTATDVADQYIRRGEAADAIARHIKRLCLRTKQPDKAAQFLRSLDGSKDNSLWYDFGPRKQKLRKAEFAKHFNHLRFDSILQYVAFPQIDLEATEENGHPEGQHRVQKNPAVLFFNWLRENTGVKQIIRVIVDDFEDLTHVSHSDEGIEDALVGFEIEILDWRRPDICPISLQKIGQSLREVNLCWSGKNPVLRAWSEIDGLCTLPCLETINIITTGGIESGGRTKQNLDNFKERLGHSWSCTWPSEKPIPVVNTPNAAHLGHVLSQPGDVQPGGLHPSSWNDQSVDPHRWMECMKNFSNEFRQIIWKFRESRKTADTPALKPVVVALIDDGTDIEHSDLSFQKPLTGESLEQYKEGTGYRVWPWWHSSSGHGTLMARLIAGICPSAVIHIIKLKTFIAKDSRKLQIDSRSAIEAIRHATELGAHIISMSWTVKPPADEAQKAEFINAIHDAATNPKGILLFCAASDQGKFSDRTFPHSANPGSSFRIGAAAATGRVMDSVGDNQTLNFILPGHDVVIDSWYDEVDAETLKKFGGHSGSSVATALAAGLAALIIECVRLGVIHTDDSPEKKGDPSVDITAADLLRIRKYETMKKAMLSIGTDQNTGNQYLEVWQLFEAKTALLEEYRTNADDRGRMEVIAGLARHFLKKGA